MSGVSADLAALPPGGRQPTLPWLQDFSQNQHCLKQNSGERLVGDRQRQADSPRLGKADQAETGLFPEVLGHLGGPGAGSLDQMYLITESSFIGVSVQLVRFGAIGLHRRAQEDFEGG